MENKKKNLNRMIAVIAFLVLFVIWTIISLRGEYLQILEIGEKYTDIFFKKLQYKYAITFINFLVLFFCLYLTTRKIKKGLKQFFDEEKKEMPKLPSKSISLIGGVLISIFTSNAILDKVMLVVNNTYFGISDPIFNMDIGYYTFIQPFIEMILLYILALIISITIYVAIYYIATFNMFFDGISRETLKNSTFIKQIINNIIIFAITIALLIFVRVPNILFQNLLTLSDEEGTGLIGASVIDATLGVWGYRIFAIIIVLATILAIKYFKQKKNKKMVFALMSIPVYLIIMFVILAGIQLIFIRKNELDKEKQYIAYNIENTKNAFSLNIEETEVENTGTITEEEITENTKITQNIPVIKKETIIKTLIENKSNLGYYSYNNTNIAKYRVSGEDKLIYLSPREILNNGERLTDNRLYKYTHGYGIIFSSATTLSNLNGVQYIEENEEDSLKLTQPRIYYGLESNETVLTNVKNQEEYDYPIDSYSNAKYTYDGAAGISLNFMDRMILSLTDKDTNIGFVSGITDESKALTNKNIIERAKTLMPYLMYDENPYLVIREDGTLYWVLDAYTTSNKYPYSQSATIEHEGEKKEINYIRNSIKVIVDSYNGEMKFYITDRTDPIAMAYRKMYTTLFADLDETIPEDISSHIVYPKLLFDIQAEMLEKYHNIGTEVLYRGDDSWKIAKNSSKAATLSGTELESKYIMTKNGKENELGVITAYTPYGKQNLISYLIGTYNSGNKLKLCRFSSNNSILGPVQLNTQIEQDETISKELQALNVTGSKISREVLIIPIEKTILYVEPVYQVLLNESDVPVLKKVIVASGSKVAIGNDVQEAIKNLLSKNAVNIEISDEENEKDLINLIIKANANLTESTENNDWEMMGKDLQRLQSLINQLEVIKQKEEIKQPEITTRETNVTSLNNIINE